MPTHTANSKLQVIQDNQLMIDFDAFRKNPLLSVGEIFDTIDSVLLSKLTEDRRLERKPPGIHGKELGEYISMWANTGPDGGLIAVGVADKGAFKGLESEGPKRLNEIEKAHEIYAPDAKVITKRIYVMNDKSEHDFIVIIRVCFAHDKVVFHANGNAYIRVSDTKKKLAPEEILELKSDRGEISFELLPSSLVWPNDFDQEAVRQFVGAVRKVNTLIEEDHPTEEVLTQRRLGKLKNGVFSPNTAAALLLASDPQLEVPGSKVHFLRFSGLEELTGAQRNAIKDVWFEGSIPELVRNTSTFIASQLREFSALGKDGKFYSDPEYPQDAWYEALVNACVHRSYGLKNVEVTVKMFENRLVVESPGGFPPTVTPENIYTTRYPRNPYLMDALLFFRYVKCSNEGAKRMRREMLSHNLPEPKFMEIEAAYCKVIVTLHNDIENRQPWVASDRLQKVQSMVFASLSDEEKKIMAFVAENGEINISGGVRAASVSWARAKRLLFKLQNRGLLIHRIRPNTTRGRQVDTKAVFTLPDTQ